MTEVQEKALELLNVHKRLMEISVFGWIFSDDPTAAMKEWRDLTDEFKYLSWWIEPIKVDIP